MVGYQPGSGDKLTVNDYAAAGAVAGFMTRLMFQPLDVLKIRFQLQIEPIKRSSHQSKYQSLSHALRCILKEEGILAFWKGHVPAQCLSILYGPLQFTSFEILTKNVAGILPENMPVRVIINFSCGAVAGVVATVGSFPFDVVRTRLVGQGQKKLYRSVMHGIKTMMIEEGPRSFFKGLLPTLVQIAPHAGAQFAFYKFFQETWNLVLGGKSNNLGILQASICGAGAGIAAKTAVYPLDLIKKRLQIQGFEEARKYFGAVRRYSGLVDCLRIMLKEEGFLAFYKGLSPSIWKAAFTTGGHFLFYEETCKILNRLKK